MIFWKKQKSPKSLPLPKRKAGFTLPEVLVYTMIVVLLGPLLVLFLQRTFQYQSYMQDRMKLAEVAGILVRDFKRDLRKTTVGDIQILENGTNIALTQMEAVKPDQSLKWHDELVLYSHNELEQKVYRWRGALGSVPPPDRHKSWPLVKAFVVEPNSDSRTVNFEITMEFKDRRGELHQYQTQGMIDLMGGYAVQ